MTDAQFDIIVSLLQQIVRNQEQAREERRYRHTWTATTPHKYEEPFTTIIREIAKGDQT
jgi:hypothetical protein